MNIIVASILLVLSLQTNDCTNEMYSKLNRVFTWHGREYQVTFIETGKDRAWPEDLVMRWHKPGATKWHTVKTIDGVRIEKEIKLADKQGKDIDALVVSAPGGSAQFISVVEIRRNPPGLRLLLDRARDKGGFDYRYDSRNRLIGFKFKYWLWHVDVGGVWGHAFSAINHGWSQDRRKFNEGPSYIDDEGEQKSTLAEILTHIVWHEMPYEGETRDDLNDTNTFVYSPKGILWQKTPPELRSAKRIRAVVKYSTGEEHEPYIAKIEAVN